MLKLDFFNKTLPPRPMGRYAHIVMLRVTEGFAVFRTDGELNKARVSAGIEDTNPMTRITLFKRKQTTPERLNGRELLRRYNHMPSECVYNDVSCKRCPDCITYGFAVGDGGSEKSKVYSDTAFSLTDYGSSHEVFTLNAPYEDGTMSDKGEVSSRINQQDHVKPQTIFPSVMTTRDLTESLFGYVLLNVLRTTRYGATTTRGGTMHNHIVAIVLSDGEIFSNLLFTQRLHDVIHPVPNDPIKLTDALDRAEQVIPELLAQGSVRNEQVLMGNELAQFLDSVRSMDEAALRGLLEGASAETNAYHVAYIAKATPTKNK
jgi:CRISPR-associated protein Csc2